MKISIALAAMLGLASAGHVSVRMPYLNPAGVTYYQGQHAYSAPSAYAIPQEYQPYSTHQQIAYEQEAAYEAYNPYAHATHEHEKQIVHEHQPAVYSHGRSVGIAHVPVKTAVAVPTVHHVPVHADVPVTKIVSQPAVVQKVVDVAKPAIKTQKYEIRRPAIQKQFYDIEERTIVRPVGSALLELDEPLSQHQKGPAVVSTLEDHHHHQIAHEAEHGVAIASSPIPHAVAVTPVPHVVAITPSAHHIVASHEHAHHDSIVVSSTPAPIHHSTLAPIVVSSTYAPHYESEDDSAFVNAAARHYEEAKHAAHEAKVAHQEALARAHYEAEAHAHHEAYSRAHHEAHEHEANIAHKEAMIRAHYDVEAQAHHEAIARANHEARAQAHAHEEAIARANYEAEVRAHHEAATKAKHQAHHEAHNAHLIVEAHSNGAPNEHVIVKQDAPVNIKGISHLSHEEAHANQHKLLKLLTARGGVAEVGFERHGHAEHVGDAGISRARVLSATPSPYHEPIDEKVKTRRIVVSRPVQTLQEIEVVQPATKIEKAVISHPTVIKTAKLGYERIQTSVPVYGKTLAPAIAHAQVPVEYYHK